MDKFGKRATRIGPVKDVEAVFFDRRGVALDAIAFAFLRRSLVPYAFSNDGVLDRKSVV